MTSVKKKSICLARSHYEVVRRVAKEQGFKTVGERKPWNLIWTDGPLSVQKMLEMRRAQNAHAIFGSSAPALQRANHFPGMKEICRKDCLAFNLNRMKEIFPKEYAFFPNTWSLPSGFFSLKEYKRRNMNSTFICKPGVGSQGRGIFLMRDLRFLHPMAKLICQVYIHKPLLIDGFKFDLRIYVLITSCDPLRIYIYDEGIARFATLPYETPSDQNMELAYMHLTNYSINKHSKSYSKEQDGSKRTMSSVLSRMDSEGWDTKKVKQDIDAVIVKTLIAVQPALRQNYRCSFPKLDRACSCFEILGFDILLDAKLRPYLLEVNHSPSFNLDRPVDAEVKEALLTDTFNKLYLGRAISKATRKPDNPSNLLPFTDSAGNGISQALKSQFFFEGRQVGNYRLIYPADDPEYYAEFLKQAPSPTFMDSIQNERRHQPKGAQPEEKAKKGLVSTTKKCKVKSCDAAPSIPKNNGREENPDQVDFENDFEKFKKQLASATIIKKHPGKSRVPVGFGSKNKHEDTQHDQVGILNDSEKFSVKKTVMHPKMKEEAQRDKIDDENTTKPLEPVKSGEFLTFEELRKSNRIRDIYACKDPNRYLREKKIIKDVVLAKTRETLWILELPPEERKDKYVF